MAACRVAGIPMSDSFRYLGPFLLAMIVVMLLVLIVPALAPGSREPRFEFPPQATLMPKRGSVLQTVTAGPLRESLLNGDAQPGATE
jgi:hypothetical protein